MRKLLVIAVVLVPLALQLTSCGGQQTGSTHPSKPNAEPSISTEPITIKVLGTNAVISDLEFQKFFEEPVKKKYPNIAMQLVRTSKDLTIEGSIASGDLPDILLASTTGVQTLQRLDVIEDLNPYFKKFNEDLNRFDPVIVEGLKYYSDKGEIVAMPYAMNFSVLLYNKDIFDKFGVPYPKDNMTWDDAEALARRVTRYEGNIQYRGLNPGGPDLMGFGLSLPYVDSKTNKSALNTEMWKMVMEKAVSMYRIPGFVVDNKWPGGSFFNDRNWAMTTTWGDQIGSLETLHKQGNPMNWDMVTIPNFKEALGYAREGDFHMLHLSKLSRQKNEAFAVLKHIASDEVQTIINKSGRLTVLQKTPDYQKSYGSDLESIKGKNLNAIFGVKPSKLHAFSEYDGRARSLLNTASRDIVINQTDINTALRNAHEQFDMYISEQNAQKK